MREENNYNRNTGSWTEEKVVNFLIDELHYPVGSIIRNQRFHNLEIDIIIQDPISKKVLSIIEVKRKGVLGRNKSGENRIITHLQKGLKNFDINDIEAYYIEMYNEIIDVYQLITSQFGSSLVKIEPQQISAFKVLYLKNEITETTKVLKSSTKQFKKICLALSTFISIILFSTFFNITPISFEQLSLIALLCALILIPFVQKLKILGVEIENYKDEIDTTK